MYIQPGHLSKKLTRSFGSNQRAKAKGANEKFNTGQIIGAYVNYAADESLSSDSENDDPLGSHPNKVKGTFQRTKKHCATSELLSNQSPRTEKEGGTPTGGTQSQELPIPTGGTQVPETQAQELPNPIGGTQAQALPTSPSQLPPEIHSTISPPIKRKRGPTKLKTIAPDGGSRIEVMFDENGEPIGDGSIKLSSFLGALVRETVPYTLSDWRKLSEGMAEVLWQSIQVRFNLTEQWQRDMVFRKMNEDWRSSKSTFVTKVINAPNEEERINLQPYNVKSLQEWKNFVKEKTSPEFKAKSDKYKDMRKKQVPLQHTMSRKGYARKTADLKADKNVTTISRAQVWAEGHRKKDGQPATSEIAKVIDDLEAIERNQPESSSINLAGDSLTQVLGPERHGRVRTFGKGMTKTKLNAVSQMNGKFAQVHEENLQLKIEMAQMKSMMLELKKHVESTLPTQDQNKATSEGTPAASTLHSQNLSRNTKCKLLDWTDTGDVVAEGRWASSDPKELVHFVPIGPNAVKVWVEVAKKPQMYLWRPSSEMSIMEEAVGSCVAWPADKVIMDSSLGSTG